MAITASRSTNRRARSERLDVPGPTRSTFLPRVDGERVTRVAETFARFLGTGRYLGIQTAVVIVWIALNIAVPLMRWDPYPFILLNLAFSTQAAYAAPLILLAQNRQDDRERAALTEDRAAAARMREDTEFLTREVAGRRLAQSEAATRQYLRGELAGQLESLREDLQDLLLDAVRAQWQGAPALAPAAAMAGPGLTGPRRAGSTRGNGAGLAGEAGTKTHGKAAKRAKKNRRSDTAGARSLAPTDATFDADADVTAAPANPTPAKAPSAAATAPTTAVPGTASSLPAARTADAPSSGNEPEVSPGNPPPTVDAPSTGHPDGGFRPDRARSEGDLSAPARPRSAPVPASAERDSEPDPARSANRPDAAGRAVTRTDSAGGGAAPHRPGRPAATRGPHRSSTYSGIARRSGEHPKTGDSPPVETRPRHV
ncbi:DUF1003 domain-containing protein [Frankia sp. AgB32]|uniref:DUF1003 domain-containing protein n=1 Tax=Frankia sp. AgB32 TaxID=631119 RepID=UPI00200F6070|nr:DUF1003 domain-containing protein [Frankia sp. AgB32]MCK9896892.1 DUF1003 domain-containing protein [Frankia sp. AgB32]